VVTRPLSNLLCLAVVVALGGCLKTSRSPANGADAPLALQDSDASVRSGRARPDAADRREAATHRREPASVSAVEPADSMIDPGAYTLVAGMANALGEAAARPGGPMVAVRAFRNQSRSTADEIAEVRSRVIDLLQSASTVDGRVRFTIDDAPEAEYTLGATVYLITRDGFDQWELYLSLRPVGANWTVWRNDQPVRLLRQRIARNDGLLYVGER